MKHYTKCFYSNCFITSLYLIFTGRGNTLLILKKKKGMFEEGRIHWAVLDKNGNYWNFRRIGNTKNKICINGRIEATFLNNKRIMDIHEKSIIYRLKLTK